MPDTNIELSAEAKKIVEDLRAPRWMLEAVARGMDLANQLTIAHITRAHLTGRGPFPVEDHKLGFRTGRLRKALRASEATIEGDNKVESSIGDNVVYAAIHEFGGRIKHRPRSGSVHLRTDADGNLLRQVANAHLAIFAKKTHKRVKEVKYQTSGHEVEMPERAPVRTGIEEKMDLYGKVISEALIEGWQKQGAG